MSMIDIKVPDIGDFKDVEVIEMLCKVGDTVTVDQSLLTVESDKASIEIPSSAAGVITALSVKLGDKVNAGSVIATLEVAGATAPIAAAAVAPVEARGAAPAEPTPIATNMIANNEPQRPQLDILVPDIGDFDAVEVIEIMVKVGDAVAVDQSLLTVESDKASMEIPSSGAGVVTQLLVKLGDKVAKGTLIARIAGAAAAVAPVSPPAAVAPAVSAQPPAAAVALASDPVQRTAPTVGLPPAQADVSPLHKPHASPTVRKFARELGVPLAEVKGTAPKGRITQDDVQAFVKGVMAGSVTTAAQSSAGVGKAAPASNGASVGLQLLPWPKVDFAKFGPIRSEPLSRIKKISGPNLARNWAMIPHVTQFDEADITALEQFRKDTNVALEKQGVKVTMLAFVMKASVAVLKKLPAFNASLDDSGANLIYKDYYHLGFAADTPNGLMVPVLKDVDKKGIAQLASETGELAKQARDGKLKPADMQGATFTISSLGGVGGTAFTPIINAPELAILGLSKGEIKPKWDGAQFVPRLMLPLCLSYDHRVIDGAMAARFTTLLAETLADMRKVLL